MQAIPLRVNDHEYDLFVVLEEENIARMRKYDPAEVVKKQCGEPWTRLKLRNVMIGFANDEDLKRVHEKARDGESAREVLRFLSRGWKYRPDLGDHDAEYLSLKKHEGPTQ